jgi:hypothetical protein
VGVQGAGDLRIVAVNYPVQLDRLVDAGVLLRGAVRNDVAMEIER